MINILLNFPDSKTIVNSLVQKYYEIHKTIEDMNLYLTIVFFTLNLFYIDVDFEQLITLDFRDKLAFFEIEGSNVRLNPDYLQILTFYQKRIHYLELEKNYYDFITK